MSSYITTDRDRHGQVRKRLRRQCDPCVSTQQKVSRLRKLERWDEMDRAIKEGEHSRTARIRANSGQMQSQAKATVA